MQRAHPNRAAHTRRLSRTNACRQRRSDARFRAVAQSANDAIISIDSQGAVVSWNHGAQRIFGYREDEMLGRPLALIIPDRYRAPHDQGVARMNATGESRVIGHTVELHGLRRNGSEFPLELSLAAWTDAGTAFYSGIIRDITERKQAEARLALQYAATQVLAAAANLPDALLPLLRTICEHLGWETGLFWSLDPQDGVLRCRGVWQQPDRAPAHSLDLSRKTSFALGVGLPGQVWATGAPLVLADLDDVVTDPLLPRMRQARADGLQGAFGFPVLAGGSVHSVMEFYDRAVWRRDADMEQAIAAIGIQIGQFIECLHAEDALRHQALHDALTDLPNRTLLRDRLDQALRAAHRDHTAAALLLLDLNRFKEINDTLGHHHGDLLLQEVARRLVRCLRVSDTVARLGGDEFALLVPGADAAGATRIAHKILSALAAPIVVEGHELGVGAGLGIAVYPVHGGDAPTLLRQADVAMYVAKRAGSGYAVYDRTHDQHSPARLTLETELRQALDTGQLLLHYQPIVALQSGHAGHVEALVRWPHPTRGLIPPDQFIPLAEQTGLIVPLTRWVLEEALRQIQVWQRAGLELGVAVNLSMRALHDPRLLATVSW
ncbi:MAG: sensor domain-containing protein, partial [Chloroflexota bacterium]